jgi:hypothetical protein
MNFVGCIEVLTWLELADGPGDHVAMAQSAGVPRNRVANVLQRCRQLGWVTCERKAGLGRYGQPGLYRITEAGRRKIGAPPAAGQGAGSPEAGSRERGAKKQGDAEREGDGQKKAGR